MKGASRTLTSTDPAPTTIMSDIVRLTNAIAELRLTQTTTTGAYAPLLSELADLGQALDAMFAGADDGKHPLLQVIDHKTSYRLTHERCCWRRDGRWAKWQRQYSLALGINIEKCWHTILLADPRAAEHTQYPLYRVTRAHQTFLRELPTAETASYMALALSEIIGVIVNYRHSQIEQTAQAHTQLAAASAELIKVGAAAWDNFVTE